MALAPQFRFVSQKSSAGNVLASIGGTAPILGVYKIMESVLIGIFAGIFSVLIYAAWMRKRVNDRGGCPKCGTPVPATTRIPKSRRQTLWGGWTCENCGTEMDHRGNELAEA